MVKQAAMASSVKDLTLSQRAEAVAASARDHLGLPSAEPQLTALRCRLDDLRHRLVQRLALQSDSASAELLTSILRLQCELLDLDLSRRMRCLTEIRSGLRDLRGLSPREMIYAAPVVLSREFGFARTMISTVRGSMWLPQHLHIDDEGADPQSRPFHEFVAHAHIQLAEAPLETELIRKRCGALVPFPQEDKRTFKGIVDASGSFGYVAAPIIVQGRAIGILHADRPQPDGIVTMEHLDQLEAFAECLAAAFERAVLEEKASQQRVAIGDLCVHVEELLGRPARPPLLSGASPNQRHDARHLGVEAAVPLLTAREREIMSYVATGATNSQIARCLVISEGTVKSHLKHIARKLHTSSRAAAVAVFAGIATAQTSDSR
jgi:DNA-binding CsgD family transcriptional regulator/GAF domain-containing protein